MSKITLFVVLFLSFYTSFAYAKSFGASICEDSHIYDCYKVKKHDTWAKLFTDEEDRDIVKRVNRINIPLRKGMVIAVPENLVDTNLLDFAPFDTQITPPGKKIILVDFSKLAFAAYDGEGNLERWGPISGGKGYCPDVGRKCNTPRGNFAIYTKQDGECVSTKFPVGRGGAPMPYCMFFYRGFALHGSPEVPGYNASHGCVRMFTSDAKWLNQEFTDGEKKVSVIVQ